MTSDSTDNKIPTLRKVFEEFPNIPMNIDIKRNDDELIDKVYYTGLSYFAKLRNFHYYGRKLSNCIRNRLFNIECFLP